MSDLVTSWLRTVVPGLWSALVTALLAWAAASAPWVLGAFDALHIDLESTTTAVWVMGVVLAVWYAVWRRVEPHVPDWLSRIVLGSAMQPAYRTGTVYPVATYSTGDKVRLTDGAVVTIGSVIMDPDAEAAAYQFFYASGMEGLAHEPDIAGLVSRA